METITFRLGIGHHWYELPQTEGILMSKLMVDFIISLDGYGAADGWPGYWGMEGVLSTAPVWSSSR